MNDNGIHWIRDDLRRAIVDVRDGRTCRYCGRRIGRSRGRACLDHGIPRARWAAEGWGGSPNQPRNLLTACRKCNDEKGARTIDEYAEYLRNVGNAAKADRVIDAWLEVSLDGDVTKEMRRATHEDRIASVST